MVVIYVLVILFGCVANVLIVVVILRYRQLHTVTNVFIVSLGLADIALCVFNLPLQLHYQLNDNWAFGSVLCSVAMTTFGVPMFASSLFILMIAVDRYLLIVYPFKRRMTVRCAMLLVGVIVVVTVGMAVPLMVYTHLVVIEEEIVKMHKIYCAETWPSIALKQVSVSPLPPTPPLPHSPVCVYHSTPTPFPAFLALCEIRACLSPLPFR